MTAFLFTLAALAAEAPEPPAEERTEPDRGMRIYLGGGSATIPGNPTVGTAELGFQRIDRARTLSGAWGLSLQTFEAGGSYLPVIDVDAILQVRQLADIYFTQQSVTTATLQLGVGF